MKKFSAVILFLTITCSCFATNYYLSNSGNDTNSGTSPPQAWQSIAQLNTVSLQPGDSIFFECGSIFRGEIVVTSGGSDVAKIYFGKYGIGNLPVISGAETVSGWSNYLGNVYNTPFTQTPAHLFADDKQMTIARYPNNGFLFHQAGIGDSAFVDTSLTQTDSFWNGASVIMRISNRNWENNKVKSFSNDTVSLVNHSSLSIEGDFGYHFADLLPLIDTANEWYYEALNQILYFNAPANADPSSIFVEASVTDYGMEIENGSSHIVIENILFEKQRKSGILFVQSSEDVAITHCIFRQQGETGINIPAGSTHCDIINNEFADISGIAMSILYANEIRVNQNSLKRIGLVPGYGLLTTANNLSAFECLTSDSITFSENIIDSAGGAGVFVGMFNSVVSKNYFSHCMLSTNDLGSIYLYGGFEHFCTIEDNTILNTMGNNLSNLLSPLNAVGIYLNYGAENNSVIHNSIAFADNGIVIANGSSFNLVHGNVIYDGKESQLKISEGPLEGSTANNTVVGNVFYSLNENSDVVKLTSSFESFIPAHFDSNYYFNPYNFFSFHPVILTDTIPFQFFYTLKQWKGFSQQDFSSKETFFFRNRYVPQGIIGNELITNGEFTNNFDGWINLNPLSLEMLLDNSSSLDYGCLKLNRTDFTFKPPVEVSSQFFPVDSGACYFVNFSTYSPYSDNVMFLQKTTQSTTTNLDLQRTFPVDSIRKDYGITFVSSKQEDFCRLDLLLRSNDTTILMDNISIKEVAAVFHNPKSLSRIFVNEDSTTKIFSLGDSVFFDLDQNIVVGSLTLSRYTSTILIFDSSLILSNTLLPQTSSTDYPLLFPSITNSHSIEHVIFKDALSYDILLQLFSLDGRKVNQQSLFKSQNQLSFTLPQLTQGLYLLRMNGNSNSYSWKIIVQ